MIKKYLRRYLPAMAVLAVIFLAFLPGERTAAAPTIGDSSVTLYVGNTKQLEYDTGLGEAFEEPDPEEDYYAWLDWYYQYYYYYYFESSDNEIVTVDGNGLLTARGVGTATVTLIADGEKAAVTVKVKECKAKLSVSELTLYKGQKATVKMTWSGKKITGYDSSVYTQDSNFYSEAWGGLDVEHVKKGTFEVTAQTPGEYYVFFTMTVKGKTFSKKLKVTVLNAGLIDSEIAVGKNSTRKIELINAEFISAKLSEYYYWSSGEAEVDKKGRIKGISEGTAYIDVTYLLPYGETQTEVLTVCVTDPVYTPFEGYLRVGDYYELQLDGDSWYSNITIESSDPEIAVGGTDSWALREVIPKGYGTCTLTITVDGKVFTDTINVINPQLSFEQCLLTKGKSKTLKVTGVPEDTEITYKSSAKKIAAVTSTGKIKAKKIGNCYITVNIGGRDYLCSVSVGTSTAISAVHKGEAVKGSTYSQARRMEKGYYDCSSFAWRSYNEAGVKLAGATSYAPTAADLAKKLEAEGKAIFYEYADPSELQPGDLIFYTGYTNGRYKNIDHVAVYYGANYDYDGWYNSVQNYGMIIHAVSAGVVTRSYDGYRNGDIVMICRPMKK